MTTRQLAAAVSAVVLVVGLTLLIPVKPSAQTPVYGGGSYSGVTPDGASGLIVNGKVSIGSAVVATQPLDVRASGNNIDMVLWDGNYGVSFTRTSLTETAGPFTFNNTAGGSNNFFQFSQPVYTGLTKFTATGCTSISSTLGAGTAGKFTVGANSCAVTITLNGATGITAANGWHCNANDQTTAAGNTQLYFTASSTTTATLSVPSTAAANDVIDFACTAF